MKKPIFLAVLAIFFYAELLAQDITPRGEFALNVDYAKFHNNDQSGYLEIYYGFHPSLLTYQLVEEKYVAGVQLTTRFLNNETQQLVINERSLLPVTETDTSATTFKFPFVSQAGYAIPFGDYTLEVVAADSLNPSRRDSVSFIVHIDKYNRDKVVCSDLELCSKINSSHRTDNPFFKNSLEVVPNATIIFGVTAYPVLFHYLELYNLNPAETYTVKTVVTDFQKRVIRESSKSRKFGVENAVEVGTTPVTSIFSGKYLLRILIADKSGKELARVEKAFFIYNPHLQAPELTAQGDQAGELAGLSEKELTGEFLKAKYIASEDEIKTFNLIDTESGKREFLTRFWIKAAKGRPGKLPIRRIDYLKKIDQANDWYAEMGKDGWQTDRGRVFILYGKPDDLERFPSMGESKPYEIWRYHSIENGVEFVFINRLGYGHFELVHSTKRGELWDDNWREYLK